MSAKVTSTADDVTLVISLLQPSSAIVVHSHSPAVDNLRVLGRNVLTMGSARQKRTFDLFEAPIASESSAVPSPYSVVKLHERTPPGLQDDAVDCTDVTRET